MNKVTGLGKLISSLLTILGVALFALPAGIIGAGLAIRVEKEESNRLKKNRTLAAIVLIQSMWRCFRVNNLTKIEAKKNNFSVIDSSNKLVIRFLRRTQFFVAKTKFKTTRNVLDLDNSFTDLKVRQLKLNSRVEKINHSIDIIDETLIDSDIEISIQRKNIFNRIESICYLIDYIENEIKKQNLLIDLFSSKFILK